MSLPAPKDSKARIAAQHLTFLRAERERVERQERTYVHLAYTYGLTVPQISEWSGLTLERVQAILGGGV